MNKVPTLVVGLGGIGCSIADMIASMLSDADKKYVGIVGLDTNAEDLKKLKIKTIQTSDARLVKEYLADHPEYAKWFPVNKFTVNRGMLTGAGQIRAISRLAALAAAENRKFIPLEDEINRVLKRDGQKDVSAFNVFIVGSITGGTGAGLFLQMPFYIRRLLQGTCGIKNIRIRGMFMGADITKNVQPSKINEEAVMVNAYACIKELNAFYLTQQMKDEENHLELEYYERADYENNAENVRRRALLYDGITEYDYEDSPDIERLDEDARLIASDGANIPYDAFYLIEGTDNAGGIGNASLETIKFQMAKMIYTILFTPVKTEDMGILDNTVLQDMEGGGMNRYSSAGMCSLRYPHERIEEYVTLRWTNELVNQEWLLLDNYYEQEKKDADSRRASDPTVLDPDIKKIYTEYFKKEISGDAGTHLGFLKKEAFVDERTEINRAVQWLKRIEGKVKELKQDLKGLIDACEVNERLLRNLDTAEPEMRRFREDLYELQMECEKTVKINRYMFSNQAFPESADTLNLNRNNELSFYGLLADVHPIAARYLCYCVLLELEKKYQRVCKLADEEKDSFEDYEAVDYDDLEEGIQDLETAISSAREGNILTRKKRIKSLINKFRLYDVSQRDTLIQYMEHRILKCTYEQLIYRFEVLTDIYEKFFDNLKLLMKNNEDKLNVLKKSFLEETYGEINVYATPEAFERIYDGFREKTGFNLPSDTKTVLFNGLYSEAANVFKNKNRNQTELEKRQDAASVQRNLTRLFETGIVDTLHTKVIVEGKGIVDMSIRDAIEKEMQMEKGMLSDMSAEYENARIEYEKGRLEQAMRIASPMMAVEDTENVTETVYLAINPIAAEYKAGIPDKGVTKQHLFPQRCAATDNQPVNIIMDEAFSQYEIICFKAKHKYLIENITKYSSNSIYAKVYAERINNLGREPMDIGVDAYKTVVNPHLNRFWHEEGFVPALGADEREYSQKELLKAFIYAMGLDCFLRGWDEEREREIWFFVIGSKAIPVRKQGKLIGNRYADLFDSLQYNGRIKKKILHVARGCMKKEKGYMNADDMKEQIGDSVLIEDLAQSSGMDVGDKNIIDIFVLMYYAMSRDKWFRLFEGLKLVLFEYLAFMLDKSRVLVNEAYSEAVQKIYKCSEVYAKEQAGEMLKSAERNAKEQVEALLKAKYL